MSHSSLSLFARADRLGLVPDVRTRASRSGKIIVFTVRSWILVGIVFSTFGSGEVTAQTASMNPAHARENGAGAGHVFGRQLPPPGASGLSQRNVFLPQTYAAGPVVQLTSTAYEAEESIAVDAGNPSMVVAAVSDFSIARFGGSYGNTTKYAWSSDGGARWSESFVALDDTGDRAPITGDGLTWQRMSDPVVAIDSTRHIAYLLNLYFDMYDNKNAVYVSSSAISGGIVQFTAVATRPVVVNTDPNTGVFEDKPWIAVDNSASASTAGNVYVAWVHYPDQASFPFGGEIHLVASGDHGTSFQPGVVLSPASQLGAVQGPQVAVDSAGRVLVSWNYCLQYKDVPDQFNAACVRSQIWGAVSTDGGTTFVSPRALTPVVNDLDGSGFASHYRKWSASAMAVDPLSGRIAIVYIDQPGPNSVTEYVVCPAAFASPCRAPVAISDTTSGQRVFPAVAIDGLGMVHVSWFDSRNAPYNSYASQLDIYATFASSVLSPFHINTRVSTSTTDFDAIGLLPSSRFIGDYSGIAAANGIAYPAWTAGYLQTATLRAKF